MAKKIKITQQQLEEAIRKIKLEEADNVTLELGGNAQDPVQKRVKDTVQNATSNGIDAKKVDVNVPNETALRCSKTYTKTQLLEARRKFLNESSNHYTKENFIKKN